MNWNDERIKEECGVFGAYDLDGGDVSTSIYYGLLSLQHRGQESCGIATSNTEDGEYNVKSYKDMGLVNTVFNKDILNDLAGNIGIGHVRYSTAGASVRENAQPLVLNYIKGTLAVAHNGNLVNANTLRRKFEYSGGIFQTNIDSEVIAYCIAKERIKSNSVEEAVSRTMKRIKGAYSIVVISPKKLIAARDPYGFKPLCIGKKNNTYIISSETCALDSIGAEFVRDVLPGEIITITKEGIHSNMENAISNRRHGRCIFEFIYFARVDSYFDGASVYDARIKLGRFLAKQSKVDADLVVGVPDSGNAAAQGYSKESGIPYGVAFIKNNYIGRTFIKPDKKSRENAVRMKLNVLRHEVKDKRIVVVDDSLVRGTTTKVIIKMLKDAGAKEVHIRISSPPFMWPCYFGIDVPERTQLIAYNHTNKEIAKIIGADSVEYLDVKYLSKLVDDLEICQGCFTGKYPIRNIDKDYTR